MCYANPALLQFTVKRLYKDAMLLARHIGLRNGNEKVLMEQIRMQFKKHMHETNRKKIEELKKDAVRGLGNYLCYEAKRMAERDRSR